MKWSRPRDVATATFFQSVELREATIACWKRWWSMCTACRSWRIIRLRIFLAYRPGVILSPLWLPRILPPSNHNNKVRNPITSVSAIKILDVYHVIDGEKVLLSDPLLSLLPGFWFLDDVERLVSTWDNWKIVYSPRDIVSNSALYTFDFTYGSTSSSDHGFRGRSWYSSEIPFSTATLICATYAFLDWYLLHTDYM